MSAGPSVKPKLKIPWRLGLDVGTNSIGAAVLYVRWNESRRRFEPTDLARTVARIFSDGRDPQSKESLAATRRVPRGARRRRDRFLQRRGNLLNILIRNGLMPSAPEERRTLVSLDPWKLRTAGLDRALTLHEFGRVLFHLNQRRGFKSNRKTDKRDDKEAEGMKLGMESLKKALTESGARTLGEYLYRIGREDRTPRGRPAEPESAEIGVRFRSFPGKAGKPAWHLFPTRAMARQEFDVLWRIQNAHHPELTDELKTEIADRIIFFQRKLKEVFPGPCTLVPGDQRAPRAWPLVQEARILHELSNLRLEHKATHEKRPLTRDERDRVREALLRYEKRTFDQIRRLLKVDSVWAFNLQDERRDHLKGDVVSARLGNKKAFGNRWFDGDDDWRQSIATALIDAEDTGALIDKAVANWGVDREAAERIADVVLPEGHYRFGETALRKIVPIMREGLPDLPLPNDQQAARAAGYEPSDMRPPGDATLMAALPYYGDVLRRYTAPINSKTAPAEEQRAGRLPNPTVHVGLNQVRKVVDKLIEVYGNPSEVVVELARDLKNAFEERQRIRKRQVANEKANDAFRRKIVELGHRRTEDEVTGRDLLIMRLWTELGENVIDRQCVYTGERIGTERLFAPGAVEVDHILPQAASLDDSPSNKLLVSARANRDKRKRTPHEAFGSNPTINGFEYDWNEIRSRVSALPKSKRWRFGSDALDLVKDKARRAMELQNGTLSAEDIAEINRTDGFLARQLIDTQYLSRLTRQYLWQICRPDSVWVIPGQLTQMIRYRWGLDEILSGDLKKNRLDHRHHAVDAFVTAMTDRALVQLISTHESRHDRERALERMPPLRNHLREVLDTRIKATIISFRPEHGRSLPGTTSGSLHEQTAYGETKDRAKATALGKLIYRKPFADLSIAEIDRVSDDHLRAILTALAARACGDKNRLKELLQQFNEQRESEGKSAIRHLRLHKVEKNYVTLHDKHGQPYKSYIPGENQYVDVYETPDGAWRGEGVTVFDANAAGFTPRWRSAHTDAQLQMRIHKGDLLRVERADEVKTYKVAKLESGIGRLVLAEHFEAGVLQTRHSDPDDSFRWFFLPFSLMKERKTRLITVDPIGRIRDPGPPR